MPPAASASARWKAASAKASAARSAISLAPRRSLASSESGSRPAVARRVLHGAAHALVLALDLLDQVVEGPAGAVLQGVAGGVEGVAGLAGADGRGQVYDDVGLEVAAPRALLELEEAAVPYTSAISGRSGGSRGSTPEGEDPVGGHDPGASAVDEAGQGEAVKDSGSGSRGPWRTLNLSSPDHGCSAGSLGVTSRFQSRWKATVSASMATIVVWSSRRQVASHAPCFRA